MVNCGNLPRVLLRSATRLKNRPMFGVFSLGIVLALGSGHMASEDRLRRDRPLRSAAESGARLASGLLHATLACLRCKDFLATGELDYAHVELLALSAALGEVDDITLDDDGIREYASLRQQEAKLQAIFEEVQPVSRHQQR